jgi:anti-sigma regulatory factor (Ser/Thr protein kinase)
VSAQIDRSLEAGAEAASRARRALADLDAPLPTSIRQDLELLVSEVVTNAVRHGGGADGHPIDMRVRVDERLVRVEVADRGPGFEPDPPPPTMFQESGWGLFLVGQLSDRWGADRTDRGVSVWFEIDLV